MMRKLRESGRYTRVTVEQGMAALDALIALGYDGRAIASACNIQLTTGYNWLERRRRGETLQLGPRSCYALVTAGTPTDGCIGAAIPARKLRALARIGWSCPDIADNIKAHGGPVILPGRLNDIRRDRFQRVEVWIVAEINNAYDRLAMTPAPGGRAHNCTRNRAARNGWPSPMAWENIEDLTERPTGMRTARHDRPRGSIDPVVVERMVAGRKGDAVPTKAERGEVVRILRERGLPDAEIERLTGIAKVNERYPRTAVDA
jgi:hypothetical protein